MTDIRILLVDGVIEDVRFVEDALAEIQESAPSGIWTSFRVTSIDRLSDALDLLATERYDVVLLSPNLDDTAAVSAFSRVQAQAPDVPVIILAGEGDETLARRMLREGAEDYLIKSEIDCRPLERTIRKSIDRHRITTALRRTSISDDLTGLYNQQGFQLLASRELMFAIRCDAPLSVLLAEVDNLEEIRSDCGEEYGAVAIMDAADVLREAISEETLLARFSGGRFGLLTSAQDSEALIAVIQAVAAAEQRAFTFVFGWANFECGSAPQLDEVIAAAEKALCENKHAYPMIS